MELHEILKTISSELGKKVLADNNIVNIISDYDSSVFEPQSLKNILKVMVSDNYLIRLFSLNKLDETDILKIKDELIKKYGFQKLQVEYIIDSFNYGLGVIDKIVPYSQRVASENDSSTRAKILTPETPITTKKNSSRIVENVATQPVGLNQKVKKVKCTSNKKQSKSSGCGCIIIGLVILGFLGALFGNSEPEANTSNSNSPDTIFMVRKEMDTIRYKDGTPKSMALSEKRDIQLVLCKDSLIMITPYKCMYPSICFDDGPTGSFYNKITKEFKTELVYEFNLSKEINGSYIYSLPRSLFPSFKEERRLCDVWFFFIPTQIAKKNLSKNQKYDTRLYLDLLEGTEAEYKYPFYKYEDYKAENKLLKEYFSL